MVTCTSCGHDITGKKFCPDCGTPVQTAPTEVATSSCPRCGGSVRASAAFCMHCGSSLGAQALAASAAPVTAVARPTTQQCPACHTEVPNGNAFCTNCGQSLTTGQAPAPAPAPSQAICVSCGAHNTPGARFCNNCGQSLAAGTAQQANTSYPQQPYTQPPYNPGYQQPYAQSQYNPNPTYQQPYAQTGYQQEPMLGQQPMVLRCPVCMAMSPQGTPACPSCHTSLAGVVPTPGTMPMQNQQGGLGGMFQGNGGNMMMGALGGAAAVIGGEMLLNGLEHRHEYDRYGYERRDDGLLGDLGELGRDIGLL